MPPKSPQPENPLDPQLTQELYAQLGKNSLASLVALEADARRRQAAVATRRLLREAAGHAVALTGSALILEWSGDPNRIPYRSPKAVPPNLYQVGSQTEVTVPLDRKETINLDIVWLNPLLPEPVDQGRIVAYGAIVLTVAPPSLEELTAIQQRLKQGN